MKKSVLLTLVIISLIFSGCKNLSLFQKAKNSLADSVNVQDESGELTVLEYSKERTAVELIFNAELAAQGRYAMPSSLSGVIDSTDYSVYASVSSDRGVTYKQYKCECTGSTMRFSNYAISTDTAVTLKIRFIAVYGSTYNADNKVMQSNEISVTIPANTKIASYDKSILMFQDQRSEVPGLPGGKVCLKLSSDIAGDTFVPVDPEVGMFDFDNLFKIEGNKLYHWTYGQENDPGITPGSYTIRIGCQAAGSSSPRAIITQTIIVYRGLTTDTWAETGSDTLNFPKSLTKEFYVKGLTPAGGTLEWPCTVSRYGEGSMLYPYQKIQDAIDRIESIGDTNSEYTIYCAGRFTENAKYTIPDGFKIKIIGIASYKTLLEQQTLSDTILEVDSGSSRLGTKLTLENIEIKGGKKGIYVRNATVILKNCDIHDNVNVEADGAGITCDGDCNLYIMDNVTIRKNKALNGGGICFYEGTTGKCVINGANTKIYANSATDGGGIFIYSNRGSKNLEFVLKNGSIFANIATDAGGGININGRDEQYGFKNPTVIIEGGKIAGNMANLGGGIYTTGFGNLTLTGGIIGGTQPGSLFILSIATADQILARENMGNFVSQTGCAGGGIYFGGMAGNPQTTQLSGGRILNNSGASGVSGVEGSGVYGKSRDFVISGSFVIDQNNDFVISSDTKFFVNTSIDDDNTCAVGLITLQNAAADDQILSGAHYESYYTKFGYVQNSAGVRFRINSSGRLEPIE